MIFTAERPFGIYLYSYFEELYYYFRGEKASAFRFISGLTPLSTNTEGLFSLPITIPLIFLNSDTNTQPN
jgi:hypothetical protein